MSTTSCLYTRGSYAMSCHAQLVHPTWRITLCLFGTEAMAFRFSILNFSMAFLRPWWTIAQWKICSGHGHRVVISESYLPCYACVVRMRLYILVVRGASKAHLHEEGRRLLGRSRLGTVPQRAHTPPREARHPKPKRLICFAQVQSLGKTFRHHQGGAGKGLVGYSTPSFQARE
jgi:hypothetical protein